MIRRSADRDNFKIRRTAKAVESALKPGEAVGEIGAKGDD